MSKAFALAGARLGYLAAAPEICDAIRVVRLPYHLSAVTQATALAALRHAPELLGRVDDLRAERDATVAWLRDAGAAGGRERRQLRAVRHLRRPARRLAGAARPRGADPRGRPRRLAAGLDRDTRGDGDVQAGTDRGHGESRRAQASSRTARIERQTSESKVLVEVDLDGSGRHDISTGVGFYDHMLTAFARHALLDLTVQTEGDTHIDAHHTVEDTAIVLGDALREALGDKAGIRRFGDATVPLDEALVQAVVDLSGRPYCVHTGEPEGQVVRRHRPRRVRRLADPPRLRDAGLPRPHRAARAGAGRPRPAPPRRDAVQGLRAGVPRRRRARPARDRRAVDQGPALSARRGSSSSTTARGTCARPSARSSGPAPRSS